MLLKIKMGKQWRIIIGLDKMSVSDLGKKLLGGVVEMKI